MRAIEPILITDLNMASNVSEDEPVYNPATSYAAGAVVRGNTEATQHLLFKSAVAGNTGQALNDPTKWLPAGMTNRWKMYDSGIATQTVNADVISSTVTTPKSSDSVALLNINAANLEILIKDSLGAEYFRLAQPLTSTLGIGNWYAWFNSSPVRATDFYVRDLPAFLGALITVTLDDYGNDVAIGAMITGPSIDLGTTQYGARIGITDYSVKETDDYGNFVILQRAYSRRGSYTLVVPAERVDFVFNVLSGLRATPTLFIGSELYGATFTYGFYKSFEFGIEYQKYSLLSIDLEGLT